MRLLAWLTPCLHSDILFKSPGLQPLAHLHRALLASSAHVVQAVWGEHSSTSLKVHSGGRGCLFLNTIFTKRTSGLYFGSCPCLTEDSFLFVLTLDLRLHTCYPSSVHTHRHPTTLQPPAQPASDSWGEDRGRRGWGNSCALHVHRLFQEPKGFW